MRRPVPSGRVAIFVATSAAPSATTSAAMWPASGDQRERSGRQADRQVDAEEAGDEAEGGGEPPPVPGACVAVPVSRTHLVPPSSSVHIIANQRCRVKPGPPDGLGDAGGWARPAPSPGDARHEHPFHRRRPCRRRGAAGSAARVRITGGRARRLRGLGRAARRADPARGGQRLRADLQHQPGPQLRQRDGVGAGGPARLPQPDHRCRRLPGDRHDGCGAARRRPAGAVVLASGCRPGSPRPSR